MLCVLRKGNIRLKRNCELRLSLWTHSACIFRYGSRALRMSSGFRSESLTARPGHCRIFRVPGQLSLCQLALLALAVCSAQAQLPDAPMPRPGLVATVADAPMPLPAALPALAPAEGQQTFPPEAPRESSSQIPGLNPRFVPIPRPCFAQACTKAPPAPGCCVQNSDVFSAYLSQNVAHVYTPGELGHLAIRGVVDPFNFLTIGGTSAISIAEDAHTPYGPGFDGWAKLSGVTLTEDITSEFVGTFLIPSIDHQDPHYHREPNAPLQRRILHCIVQPFWTNTDTGGSTLNYSTIAGSVIDEAVDVSYVPYQKTGWGPSAARISLDWATAPIGNFVTEFVPDLASHLNVRVVFIQRIIDRVAVEEGGQP